MAELLKYSVFQDVFFPEEEQDASKSAKKLMLEKVIRYRLNPESEYSNLPIVVFDFETTGLDSKQDHIIEIGAIRLENGEAVEEFSTLVNPGTTLSDQVVTITGITDEMLKDQPTIDQVLDRFLDFFKGAVLVAHNAEFDMSFLTTTCLKLGRRLEWPAFCTLKMARKVLPQLESRNLDTIAKHYDLSFEARHRSIGDVKVTVAVLNEMIHEIDPEVQTWEDLKDFYVTRS